MCTLSVKSIFSSWSIFLLGTLLHMSPIAIFSVQEESQNIDIPTLPAKMQLVLYQKKNMYSKVEYYYQYKPPWLFLMAGGFFMLISLFGIGLKYLNNHALTFTLLFDKNNIKELLVYLAFLLGSSWSLHKFYQEMRYPGGCLLTDTFLLISEPGFTLNSTLIWYKEIKDMTRYEGEKTVLTINPLPYTFESAVIIDTDRMSKSELFDLEAHLVVKVREAQYKTLKATFDSKEGTVGDALNDNEKQDMDASEEGSPAKEATVIIPEDIPTNIRKIVEAEKATISKVEHYYPYLPIAPPFFTFLFISVALIFLFNVHKDAFGDGYTLSLYELSYKLMKEELDLPQKILFILLALGTLCSLGLILTTCKEKYDYHYHPEEPGAYLITDKGLFVIEPGVGDERKRKFIPYKDIAHLTLDGGDPMEILFIIKPGERYTLPVKEEKSLTELYDHLRKKIEEARWRSLGIPIPQ